MARLIQGEPVARELEQEVRRRAEAITRRLGRPPKLLAIQVGYNAASKVYTDMQARSCRQAGLDYELKILPETIPAAELQTTISYANADEQYSGIILQMPLPPHLDARAMQMTIAPDKDVEGIHPQNLGKLFYGAADIAPCTPLAVRELLRRTCESLAGMEAVIVGHSEIVGKPIAMMLLESPTDSPTVSICHVATRNLVAHTRQADLLIVAAGVAQHRWRAYNAALRQADNGQGDRPDTPPNLAPLISAEMVKDGAIVIDVAINRVPVGFDDDGRPLRTAEGKLDMRTIGDVDFPAVAEKASAITPVPGGVGPVTVAMLLRNTIHYAESLPG
jgi:methylenetetrahydrofolate dehydrogenase (NADP+)/methenyltetrahydrofolate cyclohydrolase